ncbi:hypothetical protein FOFC_00952 [Fusarium oxysporum]|nr:hypothetical protein FOFC_00952 [Fusarium oxysporum]
MADYLIYSVMKLMMDGSRSVIEVYDELRIHKFLNVVLASSGEIWAF